MAPGVHHAVLASSFTVGPVCRLNRDLDVCAACGVRDRECTESAFGRQMVDDPGFERRIGAARYLP
jgi:hypothetical protein